MTFFGIMLLDWLHHKHPHPEHTLQWVGGILTIINPLQQTQRGCESTSQTDG